MIILGISNNLGAGASLMINNKVKFAIHEERLNRNKNFRGFPKKSIDLIFKKYNLSYNDIDIITYGVTCNSKLIKNLFNFIKNNKSNQKKSIIKLISHRIESEMIWNNKHLNQIKYYARKNNFSKKLYIFEHHLSHAASAFFFSPFKQSYVFTFDGKGDFKSAVCYYAQNTSLIEKNYLSTFDSLGYFYSNVTKALGYKEERHEGKITGLAAYGKKTKLIKYFENFIKFKSGNISIDLGSDYQPFFCTKKHIPDFYNNLNKYSKEDVAFAAQFILEKYVTKWIKNNIPKSKKINICLAGGVFANVKLNQRIREIKNINSVYVHPAMGDSGLSLGSSAAYLMSSKKTNGIFLNTSSLGDQYSDIEIKKFLDKNKINYDVVKDIASSLYNDINNNNNPVGFFYGRMEYGPRALLNRSILFHAKDPSVNKWLNDRLNRTEFMPFAPVTIEEYASKLFYDWKSNDYSSDFMTMTYNCKKKFIDACPAAVHIDGTARPQIVRKKSNPLIYKILKKYFEISNDLALLNTSFNNHEEPIVHSIADAINSLKRGNVSVLMFGKIRISSDYF